MRQYTVFNVDQCENLPDSITTGKPIRVRNPDHARRACRRILALNRRRHPRRTRGSFLCAEPRFCFDARIRGLKGADHFYNVAFHELTHWTAHKSRLDRDLKNRFGSRSYAAEELIAELGAAFLCAEFGFDGDVRNAGYIGPWVELLKA